MTKLSGCLFRLFFLATFLSLATRFIMGMFEPGTSETMSLFELLAPIHPQLQSFTDFLILPVQWLCQQIQSFTGKTFLEATPAYEFFDTVAHLLLTIPGLGDSEAGKALINQDYTIRFPGDMEWMAVGAMVFWYCVELLLAFIDLTITRVRYQITRDLAAKQQKELAKNFPPPGGPPKGPFSP